MTIHKTCQWTMILVVMLAAGGWYAFQYVVEHKHQLVLDGLRHAVARTVPDWGVTVGDAGLDMGGRLWMTDVAVTPDPSQPPVVTIPKCLITLDADLLLEQKRFLIRSVRIFDPQVHVSRDSEGLWNWQRLSQPSRSDQTPEITIEQGDVMVRLAAAEGVPETEVASSDVNLRLIPSGRRRYLIDGASQLDVVGALDFGGEIDLNSGAWRLAGRADKIDMSQTLLEKAAALAPDVGRKVAELSDRESVIPGAGPPVPASTGVPPVRTVSIEQRSAAGQLQLPNLGLSASVGIQFDLESNGAQPTPDYTVIAKIVDGTVTEPLSPVPLKDLQGELLLENGRLVVHDLTATGGASRLSVSGEMTQADGRTLRDFEISASNLLIDEELRYLLPPETRRWFDLINPSGLFTIRGRFRGDGSGNPQVRLDEFTAIDCSMRHQLFPYPITGITGTVKQEQEKLVLDLQGMAAQRPVFITGTVAHPGPEAAATVDVVVDDIPLDDLFVSCLVDARHRDARMAIEELNLTGLLDVRARFVRRAGLAQPTVMGIDGDLTQGTLNFNKFPYMLSGLTGHIHFNPWKKRVWEFTELKGHHNRVEVSGEATYDLHVPGGLLGLTLDATNVPFDRDLHRATTTANPSLQQAWVELNPTGGVAQLRDVQVVWIPGQTPAVELPSIRVDKAVLTMPSFPFRWEDVNGNGSWKDGRVTLHEVRARHNETQLRIEGRRPAAAHFDVLPQQADANWLLRLEKVEVRNLDPGGEFRRALIGDVAAVVDQLDPRGPIDADIGMEMKGTPDPQGGPDIVTAHWKMTTRFERDRLSVGVDLTDVTGQILADVMWYGTRVEVNGAINLSRARALDMTLTNVRGPFSVDDYHVSVGSAAMLSSARPGYPDAQVPLDEQLTANLYDGTVELNADTRIHPTDAAQTDYRARVEVRNADLRQWADEWGYRGMNVSGTTRAHLNLHGRGDSELGLRGQDCWMSVEKARLGELPIVAQMLTQIVAPQQRDKTAFRRAYLNFSIHDGVFDFGSGRGRAPDDPRRIQLDGDALKMIGQGYIPFASQLDPRMSLDFYSKSDPRNPLLAIPLVGQVARSMSDNWIHVRVSGSPNDPDIRTQTEVPVDNALRELFKGFEAGLMPMATPR